MNSPAGISTIGTSSIPDGLIEAGVGNGVVVGLPGGGDGGEPGVAVGATCIASASGGSVGSLAAGGVTVGRLLTSHVAAIARVGVEAVVDVGVSVAGKPLGGTGKHEVSTRLPTITNNPNPINNHRRAFDMAIHFRRQVLCSPVCNKAASLSTQHSQWGYSLLITRYFSLITYHSSLLVYFPHVHFFQLACHH